MIDKFKNDSQWVKQLADNKLFYENAIALQKFKINTQSGSIDNHAIQDNIINIMEGGEEAFDKRRDIYNLWKH